MINSAVLFSALLLALSSSVQCFQGASVARHHASALSMSTKKGAGFNYDPSNYKDSNSGNYRRLTDQLNAAKAEEEQLLKEREDLIKKEGMAAMLLKQEEDLFWNTPDSKIVATNEKYFIPPSVLQVISDLDNQLIGLKPVSRLFS